MRPGRAGARRRRPWHPAHPGVPDWPGERRGGFPRSAFHPDGRGHGTDSHHPSHGEECRRHLLDRIQLVELATIVEVHFLRFGKRATD